MSAQGTRFVSASDPEGIRQAAEILKNGGLVAFPTETVYGLGADACNPLAVARIFEVKRRPRIDPLIVHVAERGAEDRFGKFPAIAAALIDRFWPGPLTLVVPKTDRIPPIVTAGLDTVGIRMPDHDAALALIAAGGGAVAAPSANAFGYVSPTEPAHVADQLSGLIDMIVDGGKCKVGVESTVLSLAGPIPCILRAGGIAAESIEEITGPLAWGNGNSARPQAPGQLTRHYATRTPLEILPEGDARAQPLPGERVGLLALTAPAVIHGYIAVEILSKSGSLREAAANLFAALYRLDRMQLDRLVAHPIEQHGLGMAIMDRLVRCSKKNAGG